MVMLVIRIVVETSDQHANGIGQEPDGKNFHQALLDQYCEDNITLAACRIPKDLVNHPIPNGVEATTQTSSQNTRRGDSSLIECKRAVDGSLDRETWLCTYCLVGPLGSSSQ